MMLYYIILIYLQLHISLTQRLFIDLVVPETNNQKQYLHQIQQSFISLYKVVLGSIVFINFTATRFSFKKNFN